MSSAYPPAHYNEPDREAQLRLIREQPLATLIVADGDVPLATPIPLVVAESISLKADYLLSARKEDRLQLLGHMDANNPSASLIKDGRAVLAIFHGPNTYISPTDYTTKQLPTYNYKQVFVRGTLVRIDDPNKVQSDIHELVRAMEPDGNWDLSPSDPRIGALIPHVVGFRIEIHSISGRFKLSQDKKKADREAADRKLMGGS